MCKMCGAIKFLAKSPMCKFYSTWHSLLMYVCIPRRLFSDQDRLMSMTMSYQLHITKKKNLFVFLKGPNFLQTMWFNFYLRTAVILYFKLCSNEKKTHKNVKTTRHQNRRFKTSFRQFQPTSSSYDVPNAPVIEQHPTLWSEFNWN